MDDLAGRLLARAESGEGEPWEVLCLPALAEAGDPLGRAPGGALWPERYPVEELARIRAQVGSRAWAALYQQAPVPAEGGLFRRGWFLVAEPPPGRWAAVARYWDLAGTAPRAGADPDWTVGAKLARDASSGVVWVLDVVRLRGSPAEVEWRLRAVAEADGYGVPVVVEQEPGSAGVYLAEHLQRRVLAGFRVRADRPTGAKALRAEPVAAKAEAGLVRLAPGAWHAAFLDELGSFPYGAHDDQDDALSGAFAAVAGAGGVEPGRLGEFFGFGAPREGFGRAGVV